MNKETLWASLIQHEGVIAVPYQDSLGNWTVGVGHLMSKPLSQAAINQILSDDIEESISELDRVMPSWRGHNDVRQNVLVEMMFNLGAPKFKQFTRMSAALEARNYTEAAKQMLQSMWAVQVGQRAVTLSELMESGQ